MTLRVSGKNLDIGEALRRHVVEKSRGERIARYFSGSMDGHVVVTPRRLRLPFRMHVAPQLGDQPARRGAEPTNPTFASIRRPARLETRLRRYKTRLKGHPGLSAANARGKVALNYLVEQPGEEEEEPAEGFNPVVVAEGTDDLKSLSVASAVAELDLTGASVIVRFSTPAAAG